MFKLIILVLGLAIGFGGGVYYGVNHPREAATLSTQEVQDTQDLLAKMRNKLDQLSAKASNSGPISGSGIGNLLGGNNSTPPVDDEIKALDASAEAKLNMLKSKIGK